jgi:hypothetical protein
VTYGQYRLSYEVYGSGDRVLVWMQLPDARLIRTRTFAELWVHPARLTTEISESLDRVWTDDESQNRGEAG